MASPYRHIVAIGATSGIGHAMAERFVEEGSRVIVVGRRQDRLDEFVKKHGVEKATAAQFDISRMDDIPQFVAKLIREHPDIDCVFMNAGQQTQMDLAKQQEFDLKQFHHEMQTNFSSMVALTHAFLPFLAGKTSPAGLVYTSSNLAIVPAATMPAYSASKAALNAFILCLREQLHYSNSQVRVVEFSPPVVRTELHDYMGKETGRNLGMPLDEYTDNTYKRFAAGEDQIILGSIGPAETFNEIVDKRRVAFENLSKLRRNR